VACRFTEIVVDCRDPEALAAFWAAVLDYRVLSREEDEVEIGPAAGSGGPAPTLVFGRVPDPTPGKLRLHIDLSPTDRDQDDELQRLLDLGARPAQVGQTGDESWHVLQDPEGNEFCLLRTRVEAV
jgi:catechol 2,3-dioxygenase-like lactoylglutathione lyase family enzyme